MRVFSRCLYGVLSLVLGPVACSAPEYGALPADDYHLDGETVSADDGEAIEGIAINFSGYQTLSASDGSWTIEASVSAGSYKGFLVAEDIDGEANGGVFDIKQVPLNPTPATDGTLTQNDITIELDPSG